jgi:hypothetical protein
VQPDFGPATAHGTLVNRPRFRFTPEFGTRRVTSADGDPATIDERTEAT